MRACVHGSGSGSAWHGGGGGQRPADAVCMRPTARRSAPRGAVWAVWAVPGELPCAACVVAAAEAEVVGPGVMRA